VATDLPEQKQHDQALAEGLLARLVLEQAADAVVVCDDKGQITRVSRTAEQLCGCSPLRADFQAAFPVVLASPLLGGDLISNALRGALLRAEPATLTRVDGSKADLLLSATPLQTADGRTIGCVVTMVDVSEHRRADEALRASEARFRSVLDDSRDVIYRVNLQTGRYEYISPSAEAVVGYSPHQLMTLDVETALTMVHPDDVPGMRAALARLESLGEAHAEYRQRPENGDYRWLSNHMSLVKESSGRPLYRSGSIRDITEQKQAETEREGLLAELKAIVSSMPDGLITYKPGASAATINPAAHRILGVSAEDWPRTVAERARLMQVRNEAGLPVDPDTSPAARALRGETVASEIMRLQRPDGEERWVSVGAAPIIAATGEQIGALTLFSDITERRQAEEALRQSEARHRALFDNSIDAIFATAPDGRVFAANQVACRIFGMTEEELIRAGRDGITDWSDPRHGLALAERARSGYLRQELGYVRKDGTKFTAEVSSVILPDRTTSFVILRDITQRKKAEETLRESEERFRAIFEHASDAILVTDPAGSGKVLSANPAACRMFGYSAEEFVGLDRQSHIDTNDPRLAEMLTRREGQARAVGEVTCRRKDGSTFSAEFSTALLTDQLGQRRSIAIIRDVTQRKQAEEELRGARQRLESLLENSPLAVIEWSSADYRIVRWSDEATKVFGWTAEETVGRRIDELNWVYAEDWPLVEQVMAEMLSGKRPRNVNKNRNVRKDGTVIHCEWYNSTLHHPNDKFSVLSLVLDVTGRKGAEQALERSNRKLAEVLDSIQDDFYVLDRDWKFVFASRQFTSRIGKQPEDFLGHNIWEMFPKHLGTAYEENLRAVMDKRETRRFEMGGKYTEAWYRMTASPSTEGITVLGTEITENKKIEEALREADQRKNEFLAVLSHELRNPLAPIRNSTYILEHCEPGGEQAKRALAVIDRQAAQLAHLVDDLLDVTRITRNKIQLQRHTLELNELVRHTVEDHRTLFDRADVRVEFHPASRPMSVSADRNRLVQVIGNLLQNAAKFTGRDGETRITISADATERRAVIQVADTGVGMTPELVARLFQPFSQADSTLDRSKGGLGLGLALAKGLVELHGGDITARSAGLGQGAEFVVRLPLAMDDADAPQAGASASKGRRRVLIIEDNVDAADSLRDVLAFYEHEVEVAYNGRQGIAKAQEFRPDIVFCDIGLPGMDGFEVARAFRADEALKGVFLVALSGYALPEDVARAQAAGFDRHLAKPPSLEKLEEILAEVP
jgi:PAS domain S-box-containing protein